MLLSPERRTSHPRRRRLAAALVTCSLIPALAYGTEALRGSAEQRAVPTGPFAGASPLADESSLAAPSRPPATARPRHAPLPVTVRRTTSRLPRATRAGARSSRPSPLRHSAAPRPAKSPARTSSPAAPSRPSGGYIDPSIANSVLAQLNSERQAHGLRALALNPQLISSAHTHNLTMARADTMSHQLPGEAYFADRIRAAGYRYQDAGENIGWNSAISRNAALALETTMYAEGPPPSGSVNHYSNIVSTQYTDVGIDVWIDTIHHKLWLTEDFGDR
ncbi:MAG: CAP domain-containing protein [Jatrophihabitantaceae bacterium]